MRNVKTLSIMAICLYMAGCADARDTVPGCDTTCRDDQGCIGQLCYDLCSEKTPCANMDDFCIDNLCVSRDRICDPNSGIRVCSADQRQVLHCPYGIGYVVEKTCEPNEICDSGICTPYFCSPGTKRCLNNSVELCDKDGYYRVYTQCGPNEYCNEPEAKCEPLNSCIENNIRCGSDGKSIETCSGNQWVQTESCGILSCDPVTISCVDNSSCLSGSKTCYGEKLKICNNQKWQIQACPEDEICIEGICTATCVEGAMRCFTNGSVTEIQICRDHQYQTMKPCYSGTVCRQAGTTAECITSSVSCTENSWKCTDNNLYQCSGGGFKLVSKCNSGQTCDASRHKCISHCGNGALDTDEVCDGDLFADSSLSCKTHDASTQGDIKCSSDCKSVDYSGCTQPGTASGDWDYIQTFNNIVELSKAKLSSTYATSYSMSEDGIDWSLKCRTSLEDDHKIDGTVALALRKKDGTFIEASNLSCGIKTLAFDWRSWGKDSDNATLTVTAGTATKSLAFKPANTDPDVFTLDVNANVTSFKIEFDAATGNQEGRIIIDNIRWTNYK